MIFKCTLAIWLRSLTVEISDVLCASSTGEVVGLSPRKLGIHTYIHTYIIYLFTQVKIRQHKGDVDLRLIKFTNLTPNKPTKISLRIQFKIIPKNIHNLLNPYCKLLTID